MELTEIASISGKGGLFKVLKPGKSGVLLESMDAAKTRIVASATQRLSLLSEISIYTTTKEGTAPLDDVLKKINQEYKNDLGVDANSDGSELKAFLKSVLPTFDEDRVYVSDIKKLVKWYGILLEQAPEVFTEQKKEA
jgi:Fe2+ transport system protein B